MDLAANLSLGFAGFWHFIVAISVVRLFSLLQMSKFLLLQAIDAQNNALAINAISK
jgi:hypothetical protein